MLSDGISTEGMPATNLRGSNCRVRDSRGSAAGDGNADTLHGDRGLQVQV